MHCTKKKPYKLLKTGMVGGPCIIFCQYTEPGKSQIHNHQYHDAKTCASIVGFDVNSFYLYCSVQEIPLWQGAIYRGRTPRESGTSSGVMQSGHERCVTQLPTG